jgi:hypothetical protein
MAGVATVDIKVKVTGIGDDVVADNSATMTVPVEVQKGYTVLATATTTGLQLFDMIDHIALNKIYGVYIKAVVGTVYLGVDTAGTGVLSSTAADLTLNVGEACYLPINPLGNLGLVVDASAVTAAIEWMILGKA